ncbi:MAG: hypothetical protein ACREQW_09845 [Candidatus Binatia bacterium]
MEHPDAVYGAWDFGSGRILPSFYLMRESAPVEKKEVAAQKAPEPSPKTFLTMLKDFRLLVLFIAQLFAVISRGTLWSGTMLLYVAYAYNSSPQLLGVLSTAAGVVGIPITFSSGYLC